MSANHLTPARVEDLAKLIRNAAVIAATFEGDANAGIRAAAMLGGVEAVLCAAVEFASGRQARAVIEEALRYVPTPAEVEARKAVNAARRTA
jgi:hypothetical protein